MHYPDDRYSAIAGVTGGATFRDLKKNVLRPERLRQVPEQFIWVDQAFVQ